MKTRELVLLTHGIASTRWTLWPLARRLRRVGFATHLHGYPSVWWSNRSHGKKLARVLRRLATQYDQIHLVVHSMGGIVARCALEEVLPENFGRVVMIAPPNRGSDAATSLARRLGWFSPTLLELMGTPDSFTNRLGPIPGGAEVGVLAARSDLKVRIDQTEVQGQLDHRVTPGWHADVLWKRETARLTELFLRNGTFGTHEPT